MKKFAVFMMSMLLCLRGYAADELPGAFFSAGPVYWKVDGTGLEYAVGRSIKELHFDWEFGFEVELGYRIPHDLWQFSVGLKHIHPTAEGTSRGILYPVWMLPSETGPIVVSHAHGHWRLHLGLLDGLMEKQIACSPSVSFTPQLGIRTGWIRQKYNLEYSGGSLSSEQTVRMKNKFWGMGPAIGMRSCWRVAGQLSLFADVLGSLLYGEFYLHQDEDRAGDRLKLLGIHGMFQQSVWTTDMSLGLRWDHQYAKTLRAVSVEIGWNQIVLFKQNQLMRWWSAQELGELISNQGDLALKGFHLEASFRF